MGMKEFMVMALFASLLFAGCLNQAPAGQANASIAASATVKGDVLKAKKGDTVSVDYTGTAEGKVFDTSVKAEAEKAGLPLRPSYAPLSFTVGAGQMIQGFDDAVVGMAVGEQKTVTLPPEKAYGPRDPALVKTIQSSVIETGGMTPAVGLKVQATNGAVGTITNVTNDTVTIDFNHALAGKTLVFKITMREIKSA